MANFNGTLNSNEVFASIYNMIISQTVFADNIGGETYSVLVNKAKTDGGLYGDQKLYYATDALRSYAWGNDAEAANLLELNRPKDPEVQSIVLDTFRQIRLTVDNYLSKRAWSTEGAFSSFTSVMMGWIGDTKKIYEQTTYNAFIGTDETKVGKQEQTIPGITSTDPATEEAARFDALKISQKVADILTDMKDVSRDYNDYGNLRSYEEGGVKFIWNARYINRIRKLDLPTIFHKEGLEDKMDENIIPERYFGKVNASSTAGAADGSVRSLVEQDIGSNHYFAGDSIKASDTAPAGTSYTVDPSIICKIVVEYPPMMSAFEVGTSFFNPRSLTENHYLTWGHNTLEHLKNYPFVTVRAGAE